MCQHAIKKLLTHSPGGSNKNTHPFHISQSYWQLTYSATSRMNVIMHPCSDSHRFNLSR